MFASVPAEPLTEVTFVHDYLQLVFPDARFNLYNTTRVGSAAGDAQQGQPAFAGALVSLIGLRVRTMRETAECLLELEFDGGTRVQVLRGEQHSQCLEAFEFVCPDGWFVVDNE